jgi:hypothetical protein
VLLTVEMWSQTVRQWDPMHTAAPVRSTPLPALSSIDALCYSNGTAFGMCCDLCTIQTNMAC